MDRLQLRTSEDFLKSRIVRPVTASKSRACLEGHASGPCRWLFSAAWTHNRNDEARLTNDEGMTKDECNVLAHARNRMSEVSGHCRLPAAAESAAEEFGDGAEFGKSKVRSKNGAKGVSDIEGKVARGSRERVRATSKFQLRKLEKGAINSV